MRQTLRELVARMPVAILSGRDLDDVRRRVDVADIVYAGSHGFDIAGPQVNYAGNLGPRISAGARHGRDGATRSA